MGRLEGMTFKMRLGEDRLWRIVRCTMRRGAAGRRRRHLEEEAIDEARNRACEQGTDLVIHINGQIRSRDSYKEGAEKPGEG